MDGSYFWHGTPFHRHFSVKRINMSLCFVLLACYLSNVEGATLQKVPGRSEPGNESENGNRTFARRQSPFNPFLNPSLIANTPASFGFPLYPSQASSFHHVPFQQFVTPVALTTEVKKESREKESESNDKYDKELKSEGDSSKEKSKQKKDKPKRKKLKVEVEAKTVEKEESKAAAGDDGTSRGCPACVGGECDPHLDPGVNISGIPIIQIIIAGLVGAVWAGVFLFILFNFIEHDHKHEQGGYDSPVYGAPVMSQYGPPHSEYGAPQSEYGTPQQDYSSDSYNVHRIANRYGRSSHGLSFNDLSNMVTGAIDKLAELYNDKDQKQGSR